MNPNWISIRFHIFQLHYINICPIIHRVFLLLLFVLFPFILSNPVNNRLTQGYNAYCLIFCEFQFIPHFSLYTFFVISDDRFNCVIYCLYYFFYWATGFDLFYLETCFYWCCFVFVFFGIGRACRIRKSFKRVIFLCISLNWQARKKAQRKSCFGVDCCSIFYSHNQF